MWRGVGTESETVFDFAPITAEWPREPLTEATPPCCACASLFTQPRIPGPRTGPRER